MSGRAQTSLPTLAMALLVLTATVAIGIAVADGSFAATERSPDQRRVAVAVSEQLVGPDAPTTTRANVLEASALANLTVASVRDRFPVVGNRSFRIRVGDRTVVADGSVDQGTTVRRIVLLSERQRLSYQPSFVGGPETTVPRRTSRVRLQIDPPNGTVVETVRANDEVVLHDDRGLAGTLDVDVSRFETTRLRFAVNGSLSAGDVTVTYFPSETTKATVEVTVGAQR
jgi:hypothetical protein